MFLRAGTEGFEPPTAGTKNRSSTVELRPNVWCCPKATRLVYLICVGIANAIAAQAPLAVVATRLNALKAVGQGPVIAMQEFLATQQRLSRSEDAAEGVRSFVERRDARFQGR